VSNFAKQTIIVLIHNEQDCELREKLGSPHFVTAGRLVFLQIHLRLLSQ